MRVVLITLSNEVRTLGVLNLATYLRHAGCEVTVLYCISPHGQVRLSPKALDEFVSLLQPLAPDIVGISLTTIHARVAQQLTAHLKAALPSALMVWGGIHPTVAPTDSLACCDAVCLGEGEEPFADFVQRVERKRPYWETPNFWVNHERRVHRNEIGPLCGDLDSRPHPTIDWENTFLFRDGTIVPMTKDRFIRHSALKRNLYDVMASRGCPWCCTYCCNSTLRQLYRGKGRILRFRSVSHVIAELKYALDAFPETRIFNFQDDAFGAAKEEYLASFCDAYKKQIGLPFHIRVIPSRTDEKKLAILREAGLFSAVMGLQSSDRMNREVFKRPTTQKSFVAIARMLSRNGVAGRYDAIIDNPYSDEGDEEEAIRTFARVPKPYLLTIYSLVFFPYTELTRRAMEDGKFDECPSAAESTYFQRKAHRYPLLAKILRMTPFTPSSLILVFLWLRRSTAGRLLVQLYFYTIFSLEEKLIKSLRRRTGLLIFLKKALSLGRSGAPGT